LKITYDPAANAIYVLLHTPQEVGVGETEVDDDGVIIDTGADGSPRGYEFLTVRERGVPFGNLPEPISIALNDFVSSGALHSETPIERIYEP